jgi:hypothetical protein
MHQRHQRALWQLSHIDHAQLPAAARQHLQAAAVRLRAILPQMWVGAGGAGLLDCRWTAGNMTKCKVLSCGQRDIQHGTYRADVSFHARLPIAFAADCSPLAWSERCWRQEIDASLMDYMPSPLDGSPYNYCSHTATHTVTNQNRERSFHSGRSPQQIPAPAHVPARPPNKPCPTPQVAPAGAATHASAQHRAMRHQWPNTHATASAGVPLHRPSPACP